MTSHFINETYAEHRCKKKVTLKKSEEEAAAVANKNNKQELNKIKK